MKHLAEFPEEIQMVLNYTHYSIYFLLIEQQKLAPTILRGISALNKRVFIGCLFTTGIANQFETA